MKITLQQAAGNALAIAVQMKEHMMSSDTVVVQKKDKADMNLLASVPDEKLDAEVEALAHQLAQKPLLAMGLIKASLDGSFDKSLQEILDWQAAHQTILFQTPEHKEMVKAFLASRTEKEI